MHVAGTAKEHHSSKFSTSKVEFLPLHTTKVVMSSEVVEEEMELQIKCGGAGLAAAS